MAFTLATLRDEIEKDLKDSANASFSADEVDRAVALALRDFNSTEPNQTIGTISAVDDQHEYSLASLTGLLTITRIIYPYDDSDPDYPMVEVTPDIYGGKLIMPAHLSMDDTYKIRVFYTTPHAVNGLEGASATTILDSDRDLLALGAVAYAAKMYARYSVNRINRSSWTQRQWTDYSALSMDQFRDGLRAMRLRGLYSTRPSGPGGWPA